MDLTNLTFSLSGANATDFDIIGTPPTKLDAGDTTVLTIRPKSELAVGTYNVTVNVKGNLEDPLIQGVTIKSENIPVNADPQSVQKQTGSHGKVEVTNLSPSATWSNKDELHLKATPQITGDQVVKWTYAVTTEQNPALVPAADWKTMTGPTNGTDTFQFPSNTDGEYYVHWTLETDYATGINGTLTNGGITTYNIDLVIPEVQSITTTVTTVGTLPFPVTVTFTEPVDPISIGDIIVQNGSITGTIARVGAGPKHTKFTFTVQPNAGLGTGDVLFVEVKNNVTEDKETNKNLGSANGTGGANTNLNLSVNTTSPNAVYSFCRSTGLYHPTIFRTSDIDFQWCC